MASVKRIRERREQAVTDLKAMLRDGDSIYGVIGNSHVTTAGGVRRRITVLAVKDGKPVNISREISNLTGVKRHDSFDAIVLTGDLYDLQYPIREALGFAKLEVTML